MSGRSNYNEHNVVGSLRLCVQLRALSPLAGLPICQLVYGHYLKYVVDLLSSSLDEIHPEIATQRMFHVDS